MHTSLCPPWATTDCRPTAHRPKWPPRAAQAAAEFDSRVELRPSSSSSTPGPDRSDKQQEEDWAEMLECGGDNANLLSVLLSYVNLHLASSRVRLCVCLRSMRLRWKATALDFLPWTGAVLRQLTPLPLIFPPAMFSFICLLECIENIAN